MPLSVRLLFKAIARGLYRLSPSLRRRSESGKGPGVRLDGYVPLYPARASNGFTKKETEMAECSHLDQIQEVTPSGNGCKECLEMGDTWVHLRLCLICGHVGCCDSSKNKHATKHFHETNHPIIQSFEPGEDWGWCYIDQVMLEPG